MASNNLTPTPIVDKNGKQTTVHKRASAPVKKTRMPAPVSPATKSMDEDTARVMKMLGLKGNDARRHISSVLWQYQKPFRVKLQTMLRQPDRELRTHLARMVSGKESPTLINECNALLRSIDVDDLELGTRLVNSLRTCQQLDWKRDYSDVSDEVRAQCIALMNTTAAVMEVNDDYPAITLSRNSDGGRPIPLITDDELIEAVLEQPESAPAIINVIRETGLTSYRPIRAVLEGTTVPLTGGFL